MTEVDIWNILYMGLISNSMYFVGMVLLTWLGFRFAARIYDDQNANVMGKVTATVFYLFVGMFFYNTMSISGDMISGSASMMSALPGDPSEGAQRLIANAASGLPPGGPISLAFNIVIVFFQLAMTWGKKA